MCALMLGKMVLRNRERCPQGPPLESGHRPWRCSASIRAEHHSHCTRRRRRWVIKPPQPPPTAPIISVIVRGGLRIKRSFELTLYPRVSGPGPPSSIWPDLIASRRVGVNGEGRQRDGWRWWGNQFPVSVHLCWPTLKAMRLCRQKIASIPPPKHFRPLWPSGKER